MGALVAGVVGLIGQPPIAAEQIGDRINLSGYGHWQYSKTDGNDLLFGTEEGDYDDGYFALNVAAQVSERVRMSAQVVTLVAGEAHLDFAFAQYVFSDAAVLSAGIVKQPFGISTDVFQVGTLRNFGSLPQSLYGPNGIVSEGLQGLSFSGRRDFASRWALAYDVYGGEMTPVSDHLLDRLREGGEGTEETGNRLGYRDVLGGRVVLETPIEGFSFGVSAYRGVMEDDDRSVEATGLHARFAGGGWDARTELFDQKPESGQAEQKGYYAEVARRLGERWQVALRTEDFEVSGKSEDFSQFEGDPRFEHRAITVGLNFWVSPNLVFRAALQRVRGLRFVVVGEDVDPQDLDRDTQLVTLGVDFSF